MVWLVDRRVAKEKLRTDDVRAERLARGLRPITEAAARKIKLAIANVSDNVDLIIDNLHEVENGISSPTPSLHNPN